MPGAYVRLLDGPASSPPRSSPRPPATSGSSPRPATGRCRCCTRTARSARRSHAVGPGLVEASLTLQLTACSRRDWPHAHARVSAAELARSVDQRLGVAAQDLVHEADAEPAIRTPAAGRPAVELPALRRTGCRPSACPPPARCRAGRPAAPSAAARRPRPARAPRTTRLAGQPQRHRGAGRDRGRRDGERLRAALGRLGAGGALHDQRTRCRRMPPSCGYRRDVETVYLVAARR